jgi:predicted nuclease with RNAse H fold
MSITTALVKEVRTEFAKLKPEKITLDGNRSLTVKEAVFALAPTLERMKRRGFDTQEIAEKLHSKGIEIKPPTLAKYLAEFRRQRERKTDRPAPPKPEAKPLADAVKPMAEKPEAVSQQSPTQGSIFIKPDTPKDEL